MSKVRVVSSRTPGSGNEVTANRYARMAASFGFDSSVVGLDEAKGADFEGSIIIAIHAFRAGAILLERHMLNAAVVVLSGEICSAGDDSPAKTALQACA